MLDEDWESESRWPDSSWWLVLGGASEVGARDIAKVNYVATIKNRICV